MPRPTPPSLNRHVVVTAALALIDENGLDAFSLPRLAAELRVRTPSLYHHFSDRAELMAAIAREIALQARLPRTRSVDRWMEWFVELGLNFRRAVLRHRNAAPVLLQYLPRDVLSRSYEDSARFLTEAGVPLQLHVLILDGLDKLTLGAALTEAARRPTQRARIFANVDPDEEPTLTSALEANPYSAEEIYAESIRCFLRGAIDGAGLQHDGRASGDLARTNVRTIT